MITVTEKAAEKLVEVFQKSNKSESAMVRVSFGGYGWGGPRLQLTLDELKNKEDVIIESQGIKVVYDSDIEPYVNGITIDYSNNWYERGFVVRGGSSC